jgi:hypothetical protein
MRLQQTITATTQTEVKLSPAVKRRLMMKLSSYAELAVQRKAIKASMKKIEAEVGTIRETTGETSIAVDGFKITKVGGTTKSLDKKKLVELGCALAWIEEATTEKPKRAYEKITCPGDKGDDDEGE